MIENYGLFWKRVGVYFGERGPNKPTQLFGEINLNREKRCVDLSKQIGIYCLYDDNFSLLYVGQAGGGKNAILYRLRDHIGDNLAERWSMFSWFGLRPIIEKDGEYVLGSVNREAWNESSLISSLEGFCFWGQSRH
ncbi:GIY-YIG nuclease family protein [Roseovarius sp. B08]|uniref:GIY-YIG nuclease family protein n=1 Tax=Roseovarius sp. B08 TaxID=3449223 RepID=UPI003EDBFAA0